ncbi:MAG: tRNA guanosine(34) transglycosylase Tgt [Phycisphaeraceae bacterium]|nr:tRNA guanosine(34) transglycosylase Tgt [Phycisphaeraceae bacterium]
MPALSFEITAEDPTTHARVGRVTTPHGAFDTPAFMPVGTQGTVKGLTPDQVRSTSAQIILGNTYHLMLRPGSDLIARHGGLQEWTRWQGPMLTDSGGFQVFSLAEMNKITDEGVRFKSHLDGAMIDLPPERSMQVQHELGADIMMAFDDCPPASNQFDGDESAYVERVRVANERTLRWLERCIKTHHDSERDQQQALFPIVQGGTDLDQRDWCIDRVCSFDSPGYAIGGVAVGEGPDEIKRVVEHTAPKLPVDKPRYLMGVGYERDIVAAVRAGVDMFDCVLPTRNGRKGYAFTPRGVVKLRNASHKADGGPIDAGCDCEACAGGYSRSYLHHLFKAGEMLGSNLVSLHNLRHFQRLMLDIRAAIAHNAWSSLARDWPVAGLG